MADNKYKQPSRQSKQFGPPRHKGGYRASGLSNVGSANSGYDALANKGARRKWVVDNSSEDRRLKGADRDQLISTARAIRRNHSIMGWGVRRHLDNVATFTFQCRCDFGNTPEQRQLAKTVDWDIEGFMTWWARPLNCDAAGRHDFPELIRLIEGDNTLDGDVIIYKIADGTIQIIEGDRVRTPTDAGSFTDIDFTEFVNGVRVDKDTGKALAYAICDRAEAGSGYVLKYLVSAADVFHYGTFERYDQVRGISPLASALNTFMDLYEAQEYALRKMKLSQILGLKYKHGPDSMPDEEGAGEPYLDPTDTVVDTNGVTIPNPNNPLNRLPPNNTMRFDFGGAPQTVELEAGEDAEFMTTDTPGTDFQAFLEKGIAIALKALDLPYSFYDEAHTNYSGSRQALLQYQLAAEQKRRRLRVLLNNITVWRISMAIADGDIVLPDGVGISDLNFKWIGVPLPWIDPLKEASANKMLVDNKYSSRQRICADRGDDWFEIMDELAQEQQYAKDKGIDLLDVPAVTASYQVPPADVEDGDPLDIEDADYVDPDTGKPSGKLQRKK